jgi:hypothetical protein
MLPAKPVAFPVSKTHSFQPTVLPSSHTRSPFSVTLCGPADGGPSMALPLPYLPLRASRCIDCALPHPRTSASRPSSRLHASRFPASITSSNSSSNPGNDEPHCSTQENPQELFNRLFEQALPILETYDIRTQVTRLPPRSSRSHPLGLGHYLQGSLSADEARGQALPLTAKAAAKKAAAAAPRQMVS